MLKRFGFEPDDMIVALLIWLCTLPLVGILLSHSLAGRPGWQLPQDCSSWQWRVAGVSAVGIPSEIKHGVNVCAICRQG